MKNIINKIGLCLIFMTTIIIKSQTIADFITKYEQIVPKLNQIAITKTQYYNQTFEQFNNRLDNDGIEIDGFHVEGKHFGDNEMYELIISFNTSENLGLAVDYGYQIPKIYITFKYQIPNEVKALVKSTDCTWGISSHNFFKHLIIEKIELVGLNGYDNPYRSIK